MKIQAFADFLERKFDKQIASHTVLESTAGEFQPIPQQLHDQLDEL